MKKIIFVILSIFISLNAFAAYKDGNVLYENLRDFKDSNSKNYVNSAIALGYVVGVADSFDSGHIVKSYRPFCIPDKVTQGQLADIVINFLAANPENRQWSGDILVVIALREKFPCQKK